MAQDSDVARVAAALKAPGLRYRSFGNDPVRAPAGGLSNVGDSYPLLGSAMESAAAMPAPEPAPLPAEPAPLAAPPIEAMPLMQEPPAPAEPPAPPPEPVAPPPIFAEIAPPPAPPMPEPVMAPPPPPPPAMPAPPFMPAPPPPAPVMASPPAVAPPPPAEPAAPAYSLLESLGRQSDLAPSMAAAGSVGTAVAPPATTLSGLLGAAGAGPAQAAPASWPSATPRGPALLPAAAVTMPLAEVMRLVAAGAPAPSSPYDAFRAAIRAPGSR